MQSKMVYLAARKLSNNLEILGVFEYSEDAENACTKYNDFVGPLPLNEKLPAELVEWPGCYYPRVFDV